MARRAEPSPSPERWLWSAVLRRIGGALLSLSTFTRGVLVAGWMLLIWTLSSQSFEHFPPGPVSLWRVCANLAHAPLFGFLALFLLALVLGRSRARAPGEWPEVRWWEALLVFAGVLAWAGIDEWHQSATPGRTPSTLDVATDAVGALCVLWIVAYLGSERASERGLRRRLVLGVALSLASALVVSFAG